MYILVILAANILGDISIAAFGGFDTRLECEKVASKGAMVMLESEIGYVPMQVVQACMTELEFEKFSAAVGERAKQMEMDGVKTQNSKT